MPSVFLVFRAYETQEETRREHLATCSTRERAEKWVNGQQEERPKWFRDADGKYQLGYEGTNRRYEIEESEVIE
jgi:hypothetical protein